MIQIWLGGGPSQFETFDPQASGAHRVSRPLCGDSNQAAGRAVLREDATNGAGPRPRGDHSHDVPQREGQVIHVVVRRLEDLAEKMTMITTKSRIPGSYAGACFLGFAIGESLGASALRIAGGIFTKIADIGSDLMKIVFNIKLPRLSPPKNSWHAS